MIDPVKLAAWRRIADAATPGPWREGSVETERVFVENRLPDALGTERVLLRMNVHFGGCATDALFIAIAREAVPELLDEVAILGRKAEHRAEECRSLRSDVATRDERISDLVERIAELEAQLAEARKGATS